MSHTHGPRMQPVRALALGLAVALWAGMAGWGPVAGSHRAVAATPTELRIWYGTDDPAEQVLAQTLAQRFDARYPAVHATLTTYSLDDLNAKMQLALAGGDPPDLVYTTPRGPGLPAYVRAGKLLDLSAVARRDGWFARLRPGLLDAYNRLLTTGAAGRNAGHIYAVPSALAVVGVLYNTSLFRRLHVRIPRTLADLEQIAARARRAGVTPLGLGDADGWVGDDWWITLVNARLSPAALAPALRLDRHFTFQAPPYRWAGAALQDWAKRGYFTPDFGGLDAQDSVDTFFQGRTAMQLVSSTENPQILSLARQTGLDVGILPFPSLTPGHPPVMLQSGYAGWAVPRAARQPAAALAFIDSMTSPETAQLLLSYGLLPAHRLAARALRAVASFQRDDLTALAAATPGIYLDSAPVPNLNATMEADIQLLLQNDVAPQFLTTSLQEVYTSYGVQTTSTRTDGEF